MTGTARDDEGRQLEHVQAELLREFGDRLSPEQVERLFSETVDAFAGAPIRTFVPVLAGRGTRDRLLRSLSDAP